MLGKLRGYWEAGLPLYLAAALVAMMLGGAARGAAPGPDTSLTRAAVLTAQPLAIIAVWQTAPDGARLAPQVDLSFVPGAAVTGMPALVVDPARRFQRIAGFGGAFNERGWQALLALTPPVRAAVLRALFDPRDGAGYSLARTPIGASDYALDAYSLDDAPGDLQMRRFSIARDERLLLPYIRAARAIAPDLAIWASPWSAPAWMKSNRSMVRGGSLLAADEPAYANYLAAYVRAYAAAGVPIGAISVQNEPTQATIYPSMVMGTAQMAHFVGRALGPLFHRLHLHTAIRVNEEPSRSRWRYSLPLLADPLARRYIAGSNLHGYHGQSVDLLRLHRAAPALDVWQTEDMHLDHPHFEYADALQWASQIAADLQNWAGAWEYWNMVTDAGARSSWGWRQDAVVIVDTHTGVVRYTPKYDALAHFSRFIRPGAYRIAVSGVPRDMVATSAQDPDGRVVLVVVNNRPRAVRFAIVAGDRHAVATVPGRGIATFVWR